MPDDPRVHQLLNELLDRQTTPEEVCGSCVELLPVVRARWRQICWAQAELDALFPCEAGSGGTLPTLPPEEAPLPTVPGYEVEAVLGCGGMGVVFRARHLRLNRLVALKMVLAGSYAGAHERERFRREAEAVAALRHPNVVQVHDVGDADGRPYFTMEYLEGGSLAQKMAGTPVPARDAAALVAELAGAVEAAHRAGIVHRDLKPANVLLSADGVPKVGDFGVARRLHGEATLTGTGTAVGTPSYMAPEQAQGRADAVGPPADVYALGAILYELLTGRPPFRGETAAETIFQLATQDPVPPSRLNRKVPRDLETICLKCLAKEPRRRYGSSGALAEDLGRFLAGRPVVARPVSRVERGWRWCRRNPRETALAGLALLMLVLIVGGAWWLDRQRTQRLADQARQEERTRQGALGALEQVRDMRRQARWAEANKALEQAALLIGEDGPEDLRRQLEQSRRDVRMAETLDGIAQGKDLVYKPVRPAQALLAYEQAFRSYDLALRDDSVAALAERVRNSEIKQELVGALDDWIFSEPSAFVAKLAAVASAADPASWRVQVRQAAAQRNVAAQALLAETAPGEEQSVRLLLALARRFLVTDEERLVTAVGAASNVGVLASPGSAGSLLAACARVSPGPDPVGYLRRLQQEHPDDFWVNFALGNALMAKHPGEAIRYYQGALAIRKLSVVVHHNLAVALTGVGRKDDAIGYLRRAVRIDPNNVPARGNLASVLALNGRIDEATGQFQQVLRLEPRNAWARYHLGLAFERQDRTKEALEQFQEALKSDPRFAPAQGSLLGSLRRLGRLDDAIEHFQQALRKDPRDANAHTHLGVALLAKDRNDEALDHFQEALRLNPGDARTHYNFAVGLLRKRRISEALHQLRQAVASDPKYTVAQKGLRTLLRRLGRLDEARAAWEAALKADPFEHNAWYGYAEFCLFLGQEDEYRQARQGLLRRFAAVTDPQIAERTSRACLLLPASGEELRQAVTLAERAVSADRSKYEGIYAHFLFVQGLAEYRQGQFARAITTMRGEASRVLGPAPRLVLAMALHRSGQVDQARQTLAAAVGAYDWRANQARDQDAWICHALRREAERMIQPKQRVGPGSE